MLEASLASLGEGLAEHFGLPLASIAFGDKDSYFKSITDPGVERKPTHLPGLAYGISSVTRAEALTGYKPVTQGLVVNLNDTKAIRFGIKPVRVTVSVSLLSATLSQHLRMIHDYYALERRLFNIRCPYLQWNSKRIDIGNSMDLCVSTLADPTMASPSGKDGTEQDRGLFYSLDGSLGYDTLLLYPEEVSLLKEIVVDWHVGRVQGEDTVKFKTETIRHRPRRKP